MKLSFFYKIFYNNITFYDASHKMTPNNRWIRIQNNYLYKKEVLPALLRNIFDLAKRDGMIPNFQIVKETVATIEPRVRIKKEKDGGQRGLPAEKDGGQRGLPAEKDGGQRGLPAEKDGGGRGVPAKKERIQLSPEQKRENRIKYEKENVEKIKAKRKEHYALNHERLLQEKRDYHKANAVRIIANKRQYRIDHKEEISLKKKEYYKKKKLAKAIENKIEID